LYTRFPERNQDAGRWLSGATRQAEAGSSSLALEVEAGLFNKLPFNGTSSSRIKVDFDLALLVITSGLYRRFANRIRGMPMPKHVKFFET
jgi:hypothetical protein